MKNMNQDQLDRWGLVLVLFLVVGWIVIVALLALIGAPLAHADGDAVDWKYPNSYYKPATQYEPTYTERFEAGIEQKRVTIDAPLEYERGYDVRVDRPPSELQRTLRDSAVGRESIMRRQLYD